jgi:hypothetical protein
MTAAYEEQLRPWVIVAIADSDEFPISKDPSVALRPFAEIRERFSTDANRWYLEGVGGACDAVQKAASSDFLSVRLTGLVLRGPATAVTTANSALYSTLVVHGKTSTDGAAAFEAYKKIDEKTNAAIVLDDVLAVNAPNEQVLGWLAQHSRRMSPNSYTYVTTLTDAGGGEPWTGSIHIQSPGKRGVPTKLTVKYLRESNTVDIQCENLGEFYLYMNDELLDLDKEVAVFVNGTQIAKKGFERDLRTMIEIGDTWGEWGRMFPARFRGVVPTKIVAPTAPPAPDPNAPPSGPQPPDKPPANPPAPPAGK